MKPSTQRILVVVSTLVFLAMLALPGLLLIKINTATNKINIVQTRSDQGRAASCQNSLELGLTLAPTCKDPKVTHYYNVHATPKVAGAAQLAAVAARNRAPTCLIARQLVPDQLAKLEMTQGAPCESGALPPAP